MLKHNFSNAFHFFVLFLLVRNFSVIWVLPWARNQELSQFSIVPISRCVTEVAVFQGLYYMFDIWYFLSISYWLSHSPFQVCFFFWPKKVAIILPTLINELLNDGAELSKETWKYFENCNYRVNIKHDYYKLMHIHWPWFCLINKRIEIINWKRTRVATFLIGDNPDLCCLMLWLIDWGWIWWVIRFRNSLPRQFPISCHIKSLTMNSYLGSLWTIVWTNAIQRKKKYMIIVENEWEMQMLKSSKILKSLENSSSSQEIQIKANCLALLSV